jgi:hypothetical protein
MSMVKKIKPPQVRMARSERELRRESLIITIATVDQHYFVLYYDPGRNAKFDSQE